MRIGVSIGNTNLRVALGEDFPEKVRVFPVSQLQSPRDFSAFLYEAFGGAFWRELDDGVLCSVVPDKTALCAGVLQQKIGKPPKIITAANCGLDVSGYAGELGADRAVCCAAAVEKYGAPLLVADCGTATTLNLIDSQGRFAGGAIAAGVHMGMEALSRSTALLPEETPSETVPVFGGSTKECLVSGAVVGTACLLEGYRCRAEALLGADSRMVLTGGHAPLVLPHLSFSYHHEPDLLLAGLLTRHVRMGDSL